MCSQVLCPLFNRAVDVVLWSRGSSLCLLHVDALLQSQTWPHPTGCLPSVARVSGCTEVLDLDVAQTGTFRFIVCAFGVTAAVISALGWSPAVMVEGLLRREAGPAAFLGSQAPSRLPAFPPSVRNGRCVPMSARGPSCSQNSSGRQPCRAPLPSSSQCWEDDPCPSCPSGAAAGCSCPCQRRLEFKTRPGQCGRRDLGQVVLLSQVWSPRSQRGCSPDSCCRASSGLRPAQPPWGAASALGGGS